MKIELGYACINENLGGFKSYHLVDLYEETKFTEVKNRIIYNFKHTLDILKWNEDNGIKLYRMTSELVPLATHSEFWQWQERNSWYWFKDPTIVNLMKSIKTYVNENKHWITFHPGQYTVLNSNRPDIVEKSIIDLNHHYYLMYYMGGKGLVIHVGGVYGDKESGIKRWITEYNKLPNRIKPFIYLENDDKSYNLADIMRISNETGVLPLIDFHHWRCNPSPNLLAHLKQAIDKWGGDLKVHLSSGKTNDKDRSHADFVKEEDLNWITDIFKEIEYEGTLWVMLESKSKNESVINLKGRMKTGESRMSLQLGYEYTNKQLGDFKSYTLVDMMDKSKSELIVNKIVYNFMHTLDILKYNEKHGIKLYRISNNLVPYATHPDFWEWQERNNYYWFEDPIVISLLESINKYVKENNHWITFHLGKHNIMNSSNPITFDKAMQDLEHLYYLMYYMGGREIVVTVGSIQGDKESSIRRWVEVYNNLPPHIKPFLKLENDLGFTVEDILNISHETGIVPVINFGNYILNESPNILNYINMVDEKWENGIMVQSKGRYYDWTINLIQQSGYRKPIWMIVESDYREQTIHRIREGINIEE